MTDKPIKACEGHCNHYRGIWGPGMKDIATCDAGVNYKELAGTSEPGWVRKLPCTRPIGNATADEQVACNKREMPTKEQIEAYDAWCDDHFKVVVTAMKRCHDHAGGKRGIRGEVECPACKGRLHYSVASVNGHLWGKCETPECLSWMQ
jgi:hypothetical protein